MYEQSEGKFHISFLECINTLLNLLAVEQYKGIIINEVDIFHARAMAKITIEHSY